MTSAASTTEPTRRFSELQSWSLFCFSVFALKLLLFAVDPLPKFVMGDSGSYIWTALTGWMPDSRSYFYGYVIRWSSVWTESLTSLLVVQLSLSAITSVLAALISRFTFKLPLRWSYLFGFLCAIDPLQLLWERYVMTETISLCASAFVLHRSLLYLRDRRVRDLALVQAFSVLLIGFRMSFLLLVQVNTVILPLIAFAPEIWARIRRGRTLDASRWAAVRICAGHLVVSVMCMLVLHTAYKRANGWLANREPAYLHATGVTVLALWAPALQPEDADDPGLADLIRRGDEFGLRNFDLRSNQLFTPDYLVDRLQKLEPNPSKADSLAKKTAMHAVWRDPFAILGLALKNFGLYWNFAAMKSYAEADFSFANPPSTDLIALLAARFHLAHENSATRSFLQRYYVVVWPYYFILLLSPLLAGVMIILSSQRRYAVLLFIHTSLVLVVSVTFGGPAIRYLQPISFMTILVLALGVKAALQAGRRDKNEAVREEQGTFVQSKPSLQADFSALAPPALIEL